ncbi:MAG TPA: hypothetical protein VLT60_05540, partial [Usitatibacter sp.]|nr:hypothetical protein [Usitatibacter sp.]
GLLGRIKEDPALVKRSGLEALEKFLADEVVPMKRTILCKAVVNEIGGMMMSSRALVGKKQQANQAEVAELNGLVGKSREVVQKLWAKITAEKNAYNAALAEYKVNHSQFSAKKAALLDLLNSQKLDATLAKSAQAIEDSWTTVGLQRGMSSLVKDMSGSFEQVFAASEDIKKLMQGVYNTFIEKFGFQKMTIPALDLDPQRTKLQLLVMQTEQFVKDPVNIVVKEKHFVVKNFYNTLVKEARSNFSSAKTQAERWVTAVVLPLEVQIKDHKAQLQSRLDNLAKINEKTTSINEQMAILKAAEADLKKQREMIESLITRVSQYEKVTEAPAAPARPAARPAQPADMMKTARVAAFEPEKTVTEAAPKQAAPLIGDDAFASMLKKPEAPAPAAAPSFDPMKTQKMEASDPQRTQRMDAQDPQRTTRLDAQDPQRTTRLDAQPAPKPAARPAARADGGDKTVQIPKLDPNFRPEATQKLDAPHVTTQKLDPNAAQKAADPNAPAPSAEQTQRLDDSIWKLQEAKRILQNINPK